MDKLDTEMVKLWVQIAITIYPDVFKSGEIKSPEQAFAEAFDIAKEVVK